MIDPLTAPVLPDSRLSTISTPKGARMGPMGWMVPCYCANCGIEGASVPEGNTFAFWLCTPCFETHGHLTPFYVIPDEVFWQIVKEEQAERYGRNLTAEETVVALADPDSLESTLARSRAALTPSTRS